MPSFRIVFLGAGLVLAVLMLPLHAEEKLPIPSTQNSRGMFSEKLKQHREMWDRQFLREQVQHPTEVHLLSYLRQAGRKLNCYFTIERMIRRADQVASALDYAMLPEAEVTSVEDLIAKLERDLDDVTVIRLQDTPPIIRLVESPLAKMENYPLNQKITLTFSGDMSELGNQIKDRLPNVDAKFYGTIPDPGLVDYFAEVKFSVIQENIITLMNRAAPRTSERWVLWGAETWIEEGKPRTYLWVFTDPELLRKLEEKQGEERELEREREREQQKKAKDALRRK